MPKKVEFETKFLSDLTLNGNTKDDNPSKEVEKIQNKNSEKQLEIKKTEKNILSADIDNTKVDKQPKAGKNIINLKSCNFYYPEVKNYRLTILMPDALHNDLEALTFMLSQKSLNELICSILAEYTQDKKEIISKYEEIQKLRTL